ncbi:DinB family protein [Actinomadura macrotermitis]|uniref:Mini-circle protein n=1 Tax=Actinomadura macrotermitis TaxID=2585200 RepID=A0A7K0C1R1_9ACTN|nr:DinB family protein [Actinomadura macrotermitis]MQY06724.1 hypothetical protein [Actinomadura macrotermitis]
MSDHPKRTSPPAEGDERATLAGFLQFHRETLARKCAGLTAGQLKQRAVPPSSLSLLGLVRHMTRGEQEWFGKALDGTGAWADQGGDDFDVDDVDAGKALELWEEACARSRAAVEAAESLDVTGRAYDKTLSLRWIITHMLEEYARHNGHADLLRERIDGVTGE